MQRGRYLLRLKPFKRDWQSSCDFEVADARSGTPLWQRRFEREVPKVDITIGSGDMLLRWDAGTDEAKQQIRNSPTLKERYDSLHDKRGAQLIVTVDGRSGANLSAVILESVTESGSSLSSLDTIIIRGNAALGQANAQVAGPWILLKDARGRFHLHSRNDGQRKGIFFGSNAELSPNGNLLVVENEPGQLSTYDSASGQKLVDYRLASPAAFIRFSYDSKRLFILTRAQHAYWLDATVPAQQNELQ